MAGLPDEGHRLRPDHHPTPFSAAEIRTNSTPGRITRTLVERAGAEPFVRVVRQLSTDAEGGDFELWTETPDGLALTEPEPGRSNWLELQGHASMPAATTTIVAETFEIPAGRFDGWRYTRTDDDGVGVFWFARSEPGMPLRYEQRLEGEVVFRLTVLEIRAR